MISGKQHARLAEWTIGDSRDRRCKRWSVHPDDVIDLTVAEMDLPVAIPVLDAVRDAVDRQAFGYPMPDELSGLPDVAAGWLRRQGVPIDAGRVRLIADVIKAMVVILRHVGRTADPVLVITPTYSRFLDAVHAAGRSATEVPMRQVEGRYVLDYERIETTLRDGASTVMLCSPSNPVGRLFDREELTALSELVEKYGARLISDEIHAPLRYRDEFVPYSSVGEAAAAHSITLTSASKAWNVPGLRCAIVALTGDTDIEVWDALPRAAKGGISPLGIEATKAALQHGDPWIHAVLDLLDVNRQLIVEHFEEAGMPGLMQLPEATYLGWIDLRRFELADPRSHLLRTARVATTSGEEHGRAGAGFVRLNFASPTDVVDDAVGRVVAALQASRGTA
ncbi:MalY/PatB family protein [Aeromicrobium sp. CTD01-1L150]|uniref:MalY/PatB family protein n=1 Tax=Aeromicrobium sp. CTD01-1L150 TaxID=3341830 RepID=UPI0035BEE146